MEPTLIPDQACCADLSGADAYIGATVWHVRPDDGTWHDLNVYWRAAPPGRREVQLVSLDPLHLAENLACACGWSGSV